ncbi:peptidase [Clostridium sp. CAG:914]|nr:peptidase [Clostridium sp. CAG:914]
MNREKIEECYKWDLSKIYSSINNIREDIKNVRNKLTEFSKYKDISYDENSLYEVINLSMEVSRIISKLEVYASLLCDEDTSINKNIELKEEINNLSSEVINATYFIEPNILKMNYSDIEKFYLKNEKLKEYERYLQEMFRYKEHTLSDIEEKLLANLSKTFGNNYETYELLKDSDMIFPNFMVNNTEYELDNSKYCLYIEDDNREIRKEAFNTIYETFKQYKNVYANLITSNIKEEVATSKIRKYKSALEEAMYKDELDVSIYDNLISVINDKIGILHKYYKLKKEVLKVDELHLYDVYANLVSTDKKTYDFENAKETVINALSILGDEYIEILKEGIKNRWIDVYPNKGKRTGGYSSGSYDTFPYILLNYQNKYDDMSTLAHELGHSMHSYFTRKNNPYQYGNYSIFVAEVASTVNELLLAKYVIKNSNNKNEKLFIINRMMELFRATIYRQTMFAEFERKIYDMISSDKPVSADILSEEYYKLNKIYFGNDVYVDDYIRYEWARIPHFYYNFYVYKYATGLSAASYITEGLLNGKIKKEDYIAFLKCGDSMSPLDSLKLTKVDLSKKEVIESATSMFDSLIDEFTKLYNEKV